MKSNQVLDLSVLQGRIKKDPKGYKDDFIKKYQHFMTLYEIFKLKPTEENKEFDQLVKFLSHVASCYPVEMKEYPTQIADLLENNAQILAPTLRTTLVQALILLRNRNLLSPTSLLSLFFKLFRCKDKKLRILLHSHIVGDIKRSNLKKKNDNLNKTLQNFMYTMLQDESSVAPRESLNVMIELYNKKIWHDRKTVNVISIGIFSQDAKIVSKVLNFFISPPHVDLDKSEEEEDINAKLKRKKVEAVKKYNHIAQKKTRKRQRKLKEALQKISTERKRSNLDEQEDVKQYNFEAMNLINDPQGYCEKVFGVLKKCKFGFDFKTRIMNLLSRLISCHTLILEPFYSYVQKYAQPHQQYITQILAILAQSCHNLVSPDILEPIVMSIANNFVSDRRPMEVIAIGLNTIREICIRCPLVMNATLLKDLIMYKKTKDKSVMMAARSLIQLYRLVNPSLLPKKERGKDTDINIKPLQYGEEEALETIPGMELLDQDTSSDGEWETIDGDGNQITDDQLDNIENSNEQDMNDNETKTENNSDDDQLESNNMDQDMEDNMEENNDNEQEMDDLYDSDDDQIDTGDIQDNVNMDENDEDNDVENNDVEFSENNNQIDDQDDDQTEHMGDEITENKNTEPHVITQEEWEKLQRIQKRMMTKDPKMLPLKRKLEQIYDMEIEPGTIEGFKRRRKVTKEDKLKSILEGRDDATLNQKPDFKSKTNEEKKKNKNYNMLRQKALQKLRYSGSLKRKRFGKHIQKRQSQRIDKHRKWHNKKR